MSFFIVFFHFSQVKILKMIFEIMEVFNLETKLLMYN